MHIDRRKFMTLAAGGAALGTVLTNPLGKLAFAANNPMKIKAIAFDAFPIFDPRFIFAQTKIVFPEHGDALQKLWFPKIFGYTWLRTSANQYQNFWEVIEDALQFSAKKLNLDLTAEKKDQLMQAFLNLKPWPDVVPALEALQKDGIRLAFLSNMTEEMLRTNMKHAGIEDKFEFVLSTDKAKAFKPDPKAYRLGIDAFSLQKEEIAFAAFAGWDAVGASWFGYPAVWVNRLGFPAEELGADITATGKDMKILTEFVKKSGKHI